MTAFHEYLNKYSLHDSIVDDVKIVNNDIVFCFQSGIYELNSLGKQTNLTTSCKMIVNIESLNIEKLWEYIDIKRIYKGKVVDMDFLQFSTFVHEHKWDLDMYFCSNFCNTILLKGYASKYYFELSVSNIRNIEFLF